MQAAINTGKIYNIIKPSIVAIAATAGVGVGLQTMKGLNKEEAKETEEEFHNRYR